MGRRIKKANIAFISLVPKGANGIAPVYKTDGSVEMRTLLKVGDSFDEHGELTAVVYAPEMRDSQGDIADAEVIKDACHRFIANGANVDIRHDNKPVRPDQARIAESFIVQKGDARFAGWKDYDGRPVVLDGAWATIIKIEDPSLRAKYRSGEWAGVSMGGTAVVEQEKADLGDFLEKLLKGLLAPKHPEPKTEMDETKILKAITDGISALGERLEKALAPKTPTEEKPEATPEKKKVEKTEKTEPQAPRFSGREDDPRALQLHERKLELFNLKKETDWTDPASVRGYREKVAALKEEWQVEDEEAGVDAEAEAEAESKPVRKAGQARGAQSPAGGNLFESQIKAGEATASQINKMRGYADVGNSKEN